MGVMTRWFVMYSNGTFPGSEPEFYDDADMALAMAAACRKDMYRNPSERNNERGYVLLCKVEEELRP